MLRGGLERGETDLLLQAKEMNLRLGGDRAKHANIQAIPANFF